MANSSKEGMLQSVMAAAHRLRGAVTRTRVSDVERGMLPSPIVPDEERHGIALIAMVKDEAAYIGEWISFHAKLGVRHFYIYDNGSSDGTCDVLNSHEFADKITVLPWASFHRAPQILAHNHAIASFGAGYRWLGFFDVDEFVFPLEDGTLDIALAHYEDLPLLALPWHMFGTSGHEICPPGMLTRNFVERAVFPPVPEARGLLNWKVFVDPARIDLMKVHEARIVGDGFQLINEDGVRFSPRQKRDPQYAVKRRLQLNHYYTRARADFEAKIAKGSISKKAPAKAAARRRSQAAAIEVATEIDTAIHKHLEPEQRR